MTPADTTRIEMFVARWQNSGGNERANYQMFFTELCEALGVLRPDVKGNVAGDPYCFDKNITIYHPSGKKTPGYIDFYKADHFVIEAKQGSEISGKGTAKRGTRGYLKAMEGAFVQAIAYARNLPSKPPFVLTCDIGSHFELWMGFSGDYGGYGARREIGLAELRKPEIFELFVDIFTNPQARNPEKIAALVTREVAADLAELAKSLERSPLASLGKEGTGEDRAQEVAQFLMRCIFTMFAEDVGLLKEDLFTRAVAERWLPNPKSFKAEVERLWQAMNLGEAFGFGDRLLRFNGGLFSEATAFDLTAAQIEILLKAARRDWRKVEPAIFGTLLERALDRRERSKLGAHYTPRSYVERLVRPVVLEPLRDRWEIVQAEVSAILGDGSEKLTDRQLTIRRNNAIALLEGFLVELRGVKVLDPACGSGNFLYVTLDLIKQLETEVFQRLADVTGSDQLRLEIEQVGPAQFLGIEINPRAAAIADLVIWIGYLQWHFKRFGDVPPIEPVLREYKNIECRDAVLDLDEVEPDVHKSSKPVWPTANYILGNPPFIGNKRMRSALGNTYVSALRNTWREIPETVDFVMYWWNQAANLIQRGQVERFGFITTNSITQSLNRQVVKNACDSGISILLAIPDHPWVDSVDGAAVRVAMTVGGIEQIQGQLLTIKNEAVYENEVAVVELSEQRGHINADLSIGANAAGMVSLKSNKGMAFQGVIPLGDGFRLNSDDLKMLNIEFDNLPPVVKPYMIGRDVVQQHQPKWVIDFFGLTVDEAYLQYPVLYQRVLELVKPLRDHNNRESRKRNWWLFGENAPKLRKAISGLRKFIVTPDTSKFKPFFFLDADVLPDVQLYSVMSDDAWILGVLQSEIHQSWVYTVGPTLEDRRRWKPAIVFDPFPFPDPTDSQKQKIRDLGERLDSHRKRVQATHPEVTITAIYNLLEKLRKAQPLDDKDKAFNQKALVSTLKQIHDELDIAVFEAYGWQDLGNGEVRSKNVEEMILERLVKLNAERAQEEKNGLIRWLRPDYQNPGQVQETQGTLEGITPTEPAVPTLATPQKWPKAFKDQLAAIRDLLRTQGGEWTVDAIVTQFKGATRQKATILIGLESLEALGIITQNPEETTIPRWYFAELQKAS